MTPDHTECTRCLRVALVHIFGDAEGKGAMVMAGATLACLRWCMAQPGVLQAEAHAHTVAATGDVPATKMACQAWARSYKLARQQYHREAVAA